MKNPWGIIIVMSIANDVWFVRNAISNMGYGSKGSTTIISESKTKTDKKGFSVKVKYGEDTFCGAPRRKKTDTNDKKPRIY